MKYTLILFLLIASSIASAQTDQKLTRQLQTAVKGFNGQIGVYVHNLKTGKTAAINADSLFPTASMIKVSILAGLMDKIEKGELKYNQKLVYRDSLLYAGEDLLGSFKDKDTIQLSKVALLMITMSDNTASLWLQKLVDGKYINNWLQDNGFKALRVNSRVAGREDLRNIYGWGVASPYEMAKLFTLIRQGKAVSPAASERMQRTLNRIYWDEDALAQIPPYVQAISKQGAVDAARSETVLVDAPHGDYVFSIMTNNNKDQRWVPDNEASVLIKKISAFLWRYFESGDKWQPAPGIDKYMLNE